MARKRQRGTRYGHGGEFNAAQAVLYKIGGTALNMAYGPGWLHPAGYTDRTTIPPERKKPKKGTHGVTLKHHYDTRQHEAKQQKLARKLQRVQHQSRGV